ncbi:MAG: inner-rane translocator [Ramlibacter sp.]|nr:inner-rane translocator [Ramlibacter sp.]MDB5911689.1 inner-rane translocator [Ramlibacter sp.]
MSATLLLSLFLNGLQFGVLLFLLAAGLTLVLGIMNFVNLAHGALYMLGAYFAAVALAQSGSFVLAVLAGAAGAALVGVVLERLAIERLYRRDHLDHVLATFGMVMFFNELAKVLWGPQPFFMAMPAALAGSFDLAGFSYPAYRVLIILVGLLAALGSYLLLQKTRLGMLIRAGSVNPSLVGALGVNIRALNALLFAIGAGLAGLAGAMAGPMLSVQSGMGDAVLITVLVVIVIGGIGSISGALFSALLVGVVDTLGRAMLPLLLRSFFDRQFANAAGPALASVSIYVLMAFVLAVRPQGLFRAARQ